MNILPQILDVCSKSFLVNNAICNFKDKLTQLLKKLFDINRKNIYVDMFLFLQESIAEISTSIIKNILELTDEEFKNSAIRKENTT